jgi:hypothetical protein
MEPLGSPVVATGGNRRQNGSAQTWPKQAKTFALGCDRLPIEAHGSTVRIRQRTLQKPRTWSFFPRLYLQIPQRATGMEPFMVT